MPTRKIVNPSEFMSFPVLQYDGPNAGYHEEILKAIWQHFSCALQKHSQILMINLVVRYPQNLKEISPSNNCFQYFITEYKRRLQNRCWDPAYIWVREAKPNMPPHWHLIIILNANKIRYFDNLAECNYYWSLALQKYYNYHGDTAGLIHQCCANINSRIWHKGVIIHRGDQAVLGECLKICSYLGKINTKQNTPPGVRKFGASQIK